MAAFSHTLLLPTTFKKLVRRTLVPIVAALSLCILYYAGIFDALSENCLDFFFYLRGPIAPSQQIVIVGIDDATLAKLGRWPIARKNHAELLEKLAKAKAVGFDILFPERDVHDPVFSEALRATPSVLALTENATHDLILPTETLSGYTAVGHILTQSTADGVIRKASLYLRNYPVLSLAMLEVADKKPASLPYNSQIFLNFYGPEFTFAYISYIDVVENRISPEFFRDRLVLIGAQAIGLGDSHITPFSATHPTPGIEIQATLLNNLLDSSYLTPTTHFSWCLAGLIFFLSLITWPSLQELWNCILVLSCSFLLIFASFLLFQKCLWVNPIPSLFALFLTYFVYIVTQGILAARHILLVANELKQKLDLSLQSTYINIPRQFLQLPIQQKKLALLPGEAGSYLEKMQEGILALNLQNRFIQHLLSEETPPLLLWENKNGEVVFASLHYRTFWKDLHLGARPLPRFDEFKEMIHSHTVKDDHEALDTLSYESLTTPRQFSIAMIVGGRKTYYQILIQSVNAGEEDFTGILATFTDVTELRELERLKSEVLAIVSHELRLPLTTILGYGEMLADILPEEQSLYAEEICKQTQRLNRMIESFLDISKIESGKYSIRAFPLNILCVVQDALTAVEYAARQKEITVTLAAPSKCSPIYGDEPLLLQMLINLLDNAIKFSPLGSTVLFEVEEREDSLLFQIQDEGQGIAAEEKDQIFNKFHRCKNVQDKDGFGLGLSLVQQVVQGHRGTIELTRHAPMGACFCIRIPKGSPQ